jgi:hypothetical protein
MISCVNDSSLGLYVWSVALIPSSAQLRDAVIYAMDSFLFNKPTFTAQTVTALPARTMEFMLELALLQRNGG